MDFQKELEKYPDATPEEKAELSKLAEMQRDIAIGASAEDFVRHPFFKTFENHMNEVISDSKGKILEIKSMEQLEAHKSAIAAVTELKQWINKRVMAGRIGKQAISMYEEDTEKINAKIQEAVDQSKM